MATWIRYQNNDSATVIFDLDRATHFRHIAANDESFIEVYADGALHSIMRLMNRDAYQIILNYIAMTTGHKLD